MAETPGTAPGTAVPDDDPGPEAARAEAAELVEQIERARDAYYGQDTSLVDALDDTARGQGGFGSTGGAGQ